MSDFDLQTLFTKVVLHHRKQQAPSFSGFVDGRPQCRYRQEVEGDTLACFAGALISDEHYDSSFEAKTAGSPRVREAVGLSQGFVVDGYKHSDKLDLLQRCHDAAIVEGELDLFCERAEKHLQEFARRWNLEMPKQEEPQ